jgi:hypothetical protein
MLFLEKIREIVYENATVDFYSIHETVYLLQVMGLSVSDYRFTRLSYGLFSLELYGHQRESNDMFPVNDNVLRRVLVDFRSCITKNKPVNSTIEDCVRLIASLHYVKMYCYNSPEIEQLLKETSNQELYSYALAFINQKMSCFNCMSSL